MLWIEFGEDLDSSNILLVVVFHVQQNERFVFVDQVSNFDLRSTNLFIHRRITIIRLEIQFDLHLFICIGDIERELVVERERALVQYANLRLMHTFIYNDTIDPGISLFDIRLLKPYPR